MKEVNKNYYKKIIVLIMLLIICVVVFLIFKYNKECSTNSIVDNSSTSIIENDNSEITIGEIDLITYDINGNIESGKTVILYDEAQNELGRSVAGSDGKINYYKVPIGNYKLVKIDENGNEINSKEVKVNGGKTTEVSL